VRVNDEPFHSYVDQMIERKSDERLLKNRDKRLWKIFGQWL
jgi:hypothetical protein